MPVRSAIMAIVGDTSASPSKLRSTVVVIVGQNTNGMILVNV